MIKINLSQITVPCVRCILIAICRHKPFDDLLRDCDLVRKSLYWDKTTADGARSQYFGQKITMIRDTLGPSIWEVDINEDRDAFSYITEKCEYDHEVDKLDSVNHIIVPKGFKTYKRGEH